MAFTSNTTPHLILAQSSFTGKGKGCLERAAVLVKNRVKSCAVGVASEQHRRNMQIPYRSTKLSPKQLLCEQAQ